ARRRPGGDHDDVGAERAARRLHRDDPPAALTETGDGRGLLDPAAVILQRPRIRLHRALRVGVATEAQIRPADRVVPHDRHQLLELTAIQQLPPEAAALADLGPSPRERQLRLAQRHADALWLVLGEIAEQLVHLRPEPLLLEAEGTVDVSGAAAVAARRFPADDPLLEHEHVDAGAGEPPARAESR